MNQGIRLHFHPFQDEHTLKTPNEPGHGEHSNVIEVRKYWLSLLSKINLAKVYIVLVRDLSLETQSTTTSLKSKGNSRSKVLRHP